MRATLVAPFERRNVVLEECMSVQLKSVKKNKRSQKGASLVEYALLVALVAVASIAAMKLLAGGISSQFSTTAVQLG